MTVYRYLSMLLLLSLVLPARTHSQDSVNARSATPGFFSYVTGPVQRLKSVGERERFSFGGLYQEPGSEFWWMSADGEAVFVASMLRSELTLFRIGVDTAEVTRIGSVPSKRYIAVRGHRSKVHLLRVDTANNRYRLLVDIFSRGRGRIVATRTLLNLPLRPSKFPTKIIWDDRLQAVAVSLNARPGVPSSTRELHVVNLQTGYVYPVNNEQRDSLSPKLNELVPLRFDASGHRLFLARRNKSADPTDSRLFEFVLESGAIKSLGDKSLPARVPASIKHDASHAVYTNASGYEIWRVRDSERIGSVARGPSQFSGFGRPLLQFVGRGNVVAISDGKGLRLLSGFAEIPSGREPAVYEHFVQPSDPNQPAFEFAPLFLSGYADKVFHFGAFTTSPEDLGPGPWMQQVKIEFPADESNARISPIKRLTPLPIPSDERTPWATGPDYQRFFNEVTSRNKYPVSVHGRLRDGKMQFLGRFFDKPEKLDFITHHGMTEDVLQRKALPYRSQGFQEVWRQTFMDQNGTKRFNIIWEKRLDDPWGRMKRFRSSEETRLRGPR